MLFDNIQQPAFGAPLAEKMRPSRFDHLIGQDAIWSAGAPLRRLVETGQFHSLLFWGPPGSGKTSAARLIGREAKCKLIELSATSTSVKEIRSAIDSGEPTLLFLDEVHRLNKGQQDVLLPSLEQGHIKFIGATTENPSFEVNNAILSRSLVFRFAALEKEALIKLLQRAVKDVMHRSEPVALEVHSMIAQASGGDARRALNLLEAVLAGYEGKPIGADDVASVMTNMPQYHDKKGDSHYDLASALIKSIRGSHPDAALYYLARLLEGGEDLSFISRRLVISASEDIGNANPHALMVATSGASAVAMLGMPEARIILAQVVTFLASSPKSNRSYLAIDQAIAKVRETKNLPIPDHLKNAVTPLMRSIGYGKDYLYAHDDYQKARQQEFMPEALKGAVFYEPGDQGYEKNLKQTLANLRPEV